MTAGPGNLRFPAGFSNAQQMDVEVVMFRKGPVMGFWTFDLYQLWNSSDSKEY